ncbi:NAD(P)H-hydrate epimerase [Demequina flava]|uniref:NAD(P)H-hydrate epimerase n=1 Tax=Demequina flava TaxID=1095025 RepID=UPI000785E298|nr:NAD(P)H-hydrate epimerase [Demequina flava]
MPEQIMTVAQIRAAEESVMRSVPGPILMARAADAVAAEADTMLTSIRGRVRGSRVVVLAGSGNNGADGLLTGARLAAWGANVVGVLTSGAADGAAMQECEEAGGELVSPDDAPAAAISAVAGADLVIDAIVGIGSKPGLRKPAEGLVAAIASSTPIISVDIPSGLDADASAADAPHVHADVTVTFTAYKACLSADPARASAGRIVLAQVGVPPLAGV